MKVVYSAAGRRRLLWVGEWWRANRPDAPGLFEAELGAALERLAAMGEMIGQAYATVDGVEIRRLRLNKCRQHLYYSVDRAENVLEIHSIWGTARGSGPPLP